MLIPVTATFDSFWTNLSLQLINLCFKDEELSNQPWWLKLNQTAFYTIHKMYQIE